MGVYLSTPNTEKVSDDGESKYDQLVYGASTMQGWRQTQEDAHNCMLEFDKDPLTSLFAVYDGHGGNEVAQYCSMYFPDHMKGVPAYREGRLEDALQTSFMEFDECLSKEETVKQLRVIAGYDTEMIADEIEAEKQEAALLVQEATMPLADVLSKYTDVSHSATLAAGGMAGDCSRNGACSSSTDGGASSSVAGVDGSPSRHADTRTDSEATRESKHSGDGVTDVGFECKSERDAECTDKINDGEEGVQNGTAAGRGGGGESGTGDGSDNNTVKGAVCDGAELTGTTEPRGNSDTNGADGSARAESSCGQVTVSGSSSVEVTCEAGASASCSTEAASSKQGPRTLHSLIFDDNACDDDDDSDSEDDEDEPHDVVMGAGEDDDMWEDCEDSEEDEELDDDDDGTPFQPIPFKDSEEPGSESGCTALVAMVRDSQLVVGNAGDSRCVLCRGGRALDLSVDHKPEDEPERQRIEAAGGKVTKDGRVNGGLNLSRAIGDHSYKLNKTLEAKDQMITAFPDVQIVTLTDDDGFFILACDGIWNVMSSQEAVDFVTETLADDPSLYNKPSRICEKMFDFCLAPDTSGDGTGCDNMTCIIVLLGKSPGKAEDANSESTKPQITAEISHNNRQSDDAGGEINHSLNNKGEINAGHVVSNESGSCNLKCTVESIKVVSDKIMDGAENSICSKRLAVEANLPADDITNHKCAKTD